MTPDELIDRLAALPLFASVSRAELEWLAERVEVRVYPAGAAVRQLGESIDEMTIMLVGRLAAYAPKGGGWRLVAEARPGEVWGAVPYSRMRVAPANLIAEEDTIALALDRAHFPALIRDCSDVTTAFVHRMVDRAREFRTADLNEDRLQSLSRLASGLAHELNNPAAAAARSARALPSLFDEADRAARALAAAGLSEAQLGIMDAVLTKCTGSVVSRSALDLADREDAITDWLERQGIDPVLADALAAQDVSLAELDQLALVLPAAALSHVIRWIAVGCEARAAARQIAAATQRVHELVSAVKGFTFMDREGIPEDVDIERGLANTIALLENKSRTKSVDIRLEAAADIPRVYGFGSELNQVWDKLIDNAIDAAPAHGTVTITVTSREDSIIVRVADNGAGIPDDIRSRVFDPFFTTKSVGEGTGLGLYLARRIVHLHHGDIDFRTQPGRTVFRVRLPQAGVQDTTWSGSPARSTSGGQRAG